MVENNVSYCHTHYRKLKKEIEIDAEHVFVSCLDDIIVSTVKLFQTKKTFDYFRNTDLKERSKHRYILKQLNKQWRK
jgi:hypothetical protein